MAFDGTGGSVIVDRIVGGGSLPPIKITLSTGLGTETAPNKHRISSLGRQVKPFPEPTRLVAAGAELMRFALGLQTHSESGN